MKHKIYVGIFATIMIFVVLGLSSQNDNPNKITGDAQLSTTLMIVTVLNGSCFTELNEGWNLVSFICEKQDMTTRNYLAKAIVTSTTINNITTTNVTLLPLNESGIMAIHTYDSFEELNKWKAYNPTLPRWVVQSIPSISTTRGYWIQMSENTNYTINGSIMTPVSINMKKGWNLASYPSKNSRNVSQSLQVHLGSDWSSVYMYNSSDSINPWKIYVRTLPANTTNGFEKFVMGYGYWINTTKTGEWYVNQ